MNINYDLTKVGSPPGFDLFRKFVSCHFSFEAVQLIAKRDGKRIEPLERLLQLKEPSQRLPQVSQRALTLTLIGRGASMMFQLLERIERNVKDHLCRALDGCGTSNREKTLASLANRLDISRLVERTPAVTTRHWDHRSSSVLFFQGYRVLQEQVESD